MSNLENYTPDELKHYGVLGMKWGVRRGNVDKAYAKASRKLEKIDAKTQKHQKKLTKYTKKADRKFLYRDGYEEMAQNQQRKTLKSMRKAEKWVKKMEKTFANTDIKLTKEQIDIGKQYAETLNMRSLSRRY